jgi:hypothetical protein
MSNFLFDNEPAHVVLGQEVEANRPAAARAGGRGLSRQAANLGAAQVVCPTLPVVPIGLKKLVCRGRS